MFQYNRIIHQLSSQSGLNNKIPLCVYFKCLSAAFPQPCFSLVEFSAIFNIEISKEKEKKNNSFIPRQYKTHKVCQPTNNAFFHLPCCLTSFLSPKVCSSSIAVCGSSSYLVFSCYCWCLRFSIFLLDRIFFELERPISRWFPNRAQASRRCSSIEWLVFHSSYRGIALS